MLSFMPYFLVTALIFGNLCKGKYAEGSVQFRISGTEFNKVASVLFQTRDAYKDHLRASKVQVTYNGLSYEITDFDEKSSPYEVEVQVAADDKLIATVFSSEIQLSMKFKLTSLYGINGQIDVSLENVTITYSGLLDRSSQLVPSNSPLTFEFSNCSAQIKLLSFIGESLKYSWLPVANDYRKNIFQNTMCQLTQAKFPLDVGESEISFTIFDTPITIRTGASSLNIKNKNIIITQKFKTSFKGEDKPPYVTIPPPSFPPPDASSQPFEIVIQEDIFNELFREFKRAFGIGVKEMTIEELLPVLKSVAELDTQGQYMSILFPPVGERYPNAVGKMVVSDADIYITIKNGSVQMHYDITSDLVVTLNCDKNRTYTAFSFTMNLYFPTQIGYDNKCLTMEVRKFGGSLTILNSTLGHIMDRVGYLFYVHRYVSGKLDEINGMIEGIPLNSLLPDGVFILVKSVSVKENNVIVGGTLSPNDLHLSRIEKKEIKWAGNIPKEDLFLKGWDRTPENPEDFKLKEVNCKKPPAKVSSGCSVKLQTIFLCFMLLNLPVW